MRIAVRTGFAGAAAPFGPILIMSVVAACANGSGLPPDVSVRDSAGVRIVDNVNVDARESGWTIPETPVYRIGWGENDPQFQSLTVGAIRSDGTAIVADERASLLHSIGPGGTPVRSMGRRGEGPGEFNAIIGVLPLGTDSVLVTDRRNARVTILAGDGAPVFQAPFQVSHGLAFYAPVARLGDQFVVLPVEHGFNFGAPRGWVDRPVFRSAHLSDREVVAELPLWHDAGASRNPVLHFGRVRAGRQGIVHLQSDRPQASWYDLDGSLLQVMRWDAETRDVNDEDWAEIEAGVRSRMRIPAARLETTLAEWRRDFAGPVPLFGLVHLDRGGNLWLGDSGYFFAWESRFNVISADGVWIGAIDFPRPVSVLDISESHALVVETNDVDVQAVALYDVLKPAR